MAHDRHTHAWGQRYESNGTSYRECSDPSCNGHQQWICALDRWSEVFETASLRRRTEGGQEAMNARAESAAAQRPGAAG